MIRTMQLPSLIWLPQEQACATALVTEVLQRAVGETVQEALVWATTCLGFDSFVFGIVANDRRPDAESHSYILTDQAAQWVRAYDERAYLEVDPRIDLAGVRCPCLVLWGARDSQLPMGDAFEYARRLRAPLRAIAGCGHLLIGERPEACADAIDSFLEKTSAGS